MKTSDSKVNNKKHQDALNVVEKFKANGGKVQVLGVVRSQATSRYNKPKRFVSATNQPRDLK